MNGGVSIDYDLARRLLNQKASDLKVPVGSVPKEQVARAIERDMKELQIPFKTLKRVLFYNSASERIAVASCLKLEQYLGEPIGFVRQTANDSEIIGSFSSQLIAGATFVVDYDAWHPNPNLTESRDSRFWTVTHNELTRDRLWTNADAFCRYEAIQCRMKESGVEVKRLFLIGDDIANVDCRAALLRTLTRHKKHGFISGVMPHTEFTEIARSLSVRCDTVALIDGVAYLMQLPARGKALMIGCTEIPLVKEVESLFNRLWASPMIESDAKWIKKLRSDLTSEERRQVDVDVRYDCEAVQARKRALPRPPAGRRERQPPDSHSAAPSS